DERQRHVVEQLRVVVQKLRRIPTPHSNAICSAAGGPVIDERLDLWRECGPFENEPDMRRCLRYPGPGQGAVIKAPDVKIRFTHGDFAPKNIMVDPRTGAIIAIVDWEQSEWFPDYWE
ncbi:hypothetical protein DACRYDRAFT_31180, partial [Dacryopinax primogenitus]